MSTADVARDLDLLRQAVGDERITYLGFSYGSYVGNTYANMFPGKVRALVIDGVLNPLIWTTGRQISSDRVATAAVAEEFNRLCDAAAAINPAYCLMSGPYGAAAMYAAVLESIKQTPVVLPDGTLLTYDKLVAQTVGCMYQPELWPACANSIAYLASALRGEVGATEKAAATMRGIVERWRAADAGRAYNNQFDASLGVLCADTQYRDPFAYYAVLDGWTAKGSIFGPYWWWLKSHVQTGRCRPIGTRVHGQPARPHRCWSSATSSTRRPTTPVPRRRPSGSRTPGCSAMRAGGIARFRDSILVS
jgi:pimeloyl-ACP methyl ester carboxylesterase